MKKLSILLATLLLCGVAGAVQFEAGIGVTQATSQGNGAWYQEGLPYKLDMRSQVWTIGVTDKITPNVNWHVNYVNLGIYRGDALAADRDEDYDPTTQSCKPGCNVARYISNGSANGISATLDYHRNGFGVNGGPYLYKPISRHTVEGWKASPEAVPQTIHVANNEKLKIGFTLGVFYEMGDTRLALQNYWNKCTPSTQACLWKSITTLSLIHKF